MESKNNLRHVDGVESHGKKWNNDDTNKCIELFSVGKSDDEISNELKRTASSIKFKRMKYIDDEINNGKTYNELAKLFKFDVPLVEKLHGKELKRLQKKLEVKEDKITLDNDSFDCSDSINNNNITNDINITNNNNNNNNEDDFIKDFDNMVKLHDIMMKTNREPEQVQELADIISIKFKQYVKDKKEKYLK